MPKLRRARVRGPYAAVAIAATIMLSGCRASSPPFVPAGPPLPFPAADAFEKLDSSNRFDGIVLGAKGKPLVVNIWASWCGPCRAEAPLLGRAARRYGSTVRFLGVDAEDDWSSGRKFVARYRLPYPNLFDKEGQVPHRMLMRGFPTTYVFDREGNLIATVVGGISERTLVAQIETAQR